MPARRKGRRVLEPYFIAERNRWRVVSYRADGKPVAAETGDDGRPLDQSAAWDLYHKLSADIKALGDLTVGTAIGWYLRRFMAVEQQNKPNSIAEAERQLKSFFYLDMNRPLRALTDKLITWRYLGHYDEAGKLLHHGAITKPKQHSVTEANPDGKPRSVATQQNEAKAAIAFLQWCVREDYLEYNPGRAIYNPDKKIYLRGKRKKGKVKLNGEQTERFIQAGMRLAEQGDLGAVASLLLLVLAMRASEVTGLVRRAVDCDFTVVNVLRGKTDPSVRALELPMERDEHGRVAAIGVFLQECLRQLCEGLAWDALVFPGEQGQRRHHKWVWDATHRICAAAGVTVISSHGLRATHLTLGEERGTTSNALVKQAGHSRVVQEAHYLAPGAKEKGAASRFKAAMKGLHVVGDDPERQPPRQISWRLRGVRVGSGKSRARRRRPHQIAAKPFPFLFRRAI